MKVEKNGTGKKKEKSREIGTHPPLVHSHAF
jgi:hypothetical protein